MTVFIVVIVKTSYLPIGTYIIDKKYKQRPKYMQSLELTIIMVYYPAVWLLVYRAETK
jgi:hypothetical protein